MSDSLLTWLRASLRTRSPRTVLELGSGGSARALVEDGHEVVVGGFAEHPANRFDCVFGIKPLFHEPDWQRVFQQAARVLRPGGLFIALAEPFRGVLTSSRQRLQGGTADRLARRQATQAAERGSLFRLNEVSRTVPFCLSVAREAGFRATVLPAAVAISRSL